MTAIRKLYQALLSGAMRESVARAMPPGSKIVRVKTGRREYAHAKPLIGKSRYLGPVDKIGAYLEKPASLKEIAFENAALAQAMREMGASLPPVQICEILAALAEAGFFRLRTVLIGTLAFQTYVPMLDLQNDWRAESTNDIDLARFKPVARAIGEAPKTPLAEILRRHGDFEPALSLHHIDAPARWIDKKTGLSIDLLAPLFAPYDEDYGDVPGLGRSLKLKFLDFLVYGEIPAVIPYGHGIAVNVPEPSRFAIHKLIVAAERNDKTKAQKDIAQAEALILALSEISPWQLKSAFEEAWFRPGFRKRLERTLPLLPDGSRCLLSA